MKIFNHLKLIYIEEHKKNRKYNEIRVYDYWSLNDEFGSYDDEFGNVSELKLHFLLKFFFFFRKMLVKCYINIF